MQTTLKVLSLAGKIFSGIVLMDWTAISPKYGLLIFVGASIFKDAVNRIGDVLDDGKQNQSFT